MILQKWIMRRSPLNIDYFRKSNYRTSFMRNTFSYSSGEKNLCKLACRVFQPARLHQAQFHTTNDNRNENEEKVRHSIAIINPFKYISLRIKIFLMCSFFDENFNEKEFLIGAKQVKMHEYLIF